MRRKLEVLLKSSMIVSASAIAATTSLLAFGYVPKTTQATTAKVIKDLGAKLPTLSLKNWGLINTEGKIKSHISAVDAWKVTEGSRDIVVAVIDTGIDPNHKSLSVNLWKSPKSPSTYGWNFVGDKANPTDEHGHGTHVAGIIGAITDSSSGVSGVAHKVSIMPIKYYSDGNTGAVNLKNTIKAINYAVENGARIINYSGGGPEFSEDEYLAIKKAEAKGILFVAAAGNERQNTDLVENYYYPAAYRLSNVISVAATDIQNRLLPSSNWGKTRVDVAAPGEHIYSTLPGGRYGFMTGTSQATAFVTGMAALILSQNPKLTPPEVKKIIISSVDKLPELADKVQAGGRVNAYTALLNMKRGGVVGGTIADATPSTGKDSALAARHPVSLLNLMSSPSTK